VAPKLNYGWRVHDFALRPLEEDRRLNILDGSVRSGKTWALHPKILYASDSESPIGGWRVLIGQTFGTIYTNVLKDLFDLINDQDYHYSEHTGTLKNIRYPLEDSCRPRCGIREVHPRFHDRRCSL
jgi:hypothetical protein